MNEAQMIKHKEVKHVHKCDICGHEYIGDAEFKRHNNRVHQSAEQSCNKQFFVKGPGTLASISPVSDYWTNWPSVEVLAFVKAV